MTKQLSRITEAVIGAAMAVHREIGPGRLKSAYKARLAFELPERELTLE